MPPPVTVQAGLLPILKYEISLSSGICLTVCNLALLIFPFGNQYFRSYSKFDTPKSCYCQNKVSFMSEGGVSHLQIYMKLWLANLFTCRLNKISDPFKRIREKVYRIEFAMGHGNGGEDRNEENIKGLRAKTLKPWCREANTLRVWN